jgi:hypothetical protein
MRSWEFFCGIWSQKSEQKAITVIASEVQRGPGYQSRPWSRWLADVEILWRADPLLGNDRETNN